MWKKTMDSNPYYIGVMSGTSLDGIDAVLVSFEGKALKIHGHHHRPYPEETRQQLLALADPERSHRLQSVYSLDAQLGQLYAQSIQDLLSKNPSLNASVRAIGCHGQTLRHFPNERPGYTVQIGDPHIIAAQTGITTVADFRRRDIALGGQGAPLAPAFHREFFHSPDENRAVVNIGGFANITILPPSGKISGFDTGPGNCFLDALAEKHLNQPFDKNGDWAASGKIDERLLSALLSHPFFAKSAPKSTGRDEFSQSWLTAILSDFSTLSPENIQATLTELTALTLAKALAPHDLQSIYLSGGGAFNTYLVSRIGSHLPRVSVQTTAALGLDPQLTESCLMAWLAQCTLNKQSIDLTDITGSRTPVILGAIYPV
jgi:anhydro-N-acetylmuramic acid kinase